MQQSSHLLAGLPACLLAAMSLAISPFQSALAQEQYRVVRQENFRREPRPDGRLLASVNEGAEVRGGEIRSGWIEITLEGWIWGASLRRLPSGSFDYEVSAASGENLRAEPNGRILARLSPGFWLEEVEVRGAWIRVRRIGWMWGRSLEAVAGAAEVETPAGDGTAQAGGAESSASPRLNRAVTLGRSTLRQVPDGDTTGVLNGDAALEILARSGEWVRVRAEGWVHENDLRPVSGDVLVGVSGAEVRAQPEVYGGRVLQWTLQYLAVQVSDGLRPELPIGHPYMLARGPMPEAGFVYVLLDDEQRTAVEALAPLAQLVVLARVRVARDRYLGNPVVDLLEMSVRER
jgi:hypothetical protein